MVDSGGYRVAGSIHYFIHDQFSCGEGGDDESGEEFKDGVSRHLVGPDDCIVLQMVFGSLSDLIPVKGWSGSIFIRVFNWSYI